MFAGIVHVIAEEFIHWPDDVPVQRAVGFSSHNQITLWCIANVFNPSPYGCNGFASSDRTFPNVKSLVAVPV
jgi:hypothetical protein